MLMNCCGSIKPEQDLDVESLPSGNDERRLPKVVVMLRRKSIAENERAQDLQRTEVVARASLLQRREGQLGETRLIEIKLLPTLLNSGSE